MDIGISKDLPLMVVNTPKERAVQRKPDLGFSSHDPQDTVAIVDRIEIESRAFREKGSIVDIYI